MLYTRDPVRRYLLLEHKVDLLEQNIADIDAALLERLIEDKTTGGRIRWCTPAYEHLGAAFRPDAEITVEAITGEYTAVIQPRVSKSQEEQVRRTKDNAEVFTPSWVCNAQNNLVDSAWFGRDGVFNIAAGQSWTPTRGRIEFPGGKRDWRAYVDKRVLEITCGEAPYLASRYDAVSGEPIPLARRIGLLDWT